MIVCSTCREFSKLTEKPSETEMKNNPFLYGSSSYRKTSLKEHAKSVMHINFAARKKNELQGEPCQNAIKASFREEEVRHLVTLFKNAFTVLKRGKPWTDYKFLCELDITKGLNIGKTYLNRNSGMQS